MSKLVDCIDALTGWYSKQEALLNAPIKKGVDSFGGVYFSPPYSAHASLLEVLFADLIIETYRDVLERPIFGNDSFCLNIVMDVDTARVYEHDGKIIVEIGRKFLVILDFVLRVNRVGMAVINVFNREGTINAVLPKIACAESLRALLNKFSITWSSTIQCSLDVQIHYFRKDPSVLDAAIEGLSLEFISCLYWIISHELSHYLCGHLGYLKQISKSQKKGISEGDSAENYDGLGISGQASAFPILDAWAAELMADGMATIRLTMFLDRIMRSFKFAKRDMSFEVKTQLTLAPVLCITLIICCSRRDEGKYLLLNTGNPPLFCRFMNSMAAIFFAVYPLENSINPTPNLFTKNLFADEVAKHSQSVLMGEFSLTIAEHYTLWYKLGVISDGLYNALIADMHILWTNIGLMRVGMSMGYRPVMQIVDNSGAPRRLNDWWELHLEIWHAAMQRLTTQSNMGFSWYIPKFLVSKLDREKFFSHVSMNKNAEPDLLIGGIDTDLMLSKEEREEFYDFAFMAYSLGGAPQDPAYMLYDNWMSQMHTFFSHERYLGERDKIAAAFTDDVYASLGLGLVIQQNFRG